jgi:hypothetical protein
VNERFGRDPDLRRPKATARNFASLRALRAIER